MGLFCLGYLILACNTFKMDDVSRSDEWEKVAVVKKKEEGIGELLKFWQLNDDL